MLLRSGFESDTVFISAHYQPAVLIDLALSRGLNSQQLLRGVRLNLDEVKLANKKISPQQYLTLIENFHRLLGADDASFLYGQRLFPGFYGACSQLVNQSINFHHFIESLTSFSALLTPLLTPRFYEDEQYLYIYWQDTCGAEQQLQFLIEATMTAVKSMTDWLSTEKLRWQFQFAYSEPDYIEQYWVNFGQYISFEQQQNMMILPRSQADTAWSNGSELAFYAALNNTQQQLHELGWQHSFMDLFYDYLCENIHKPINLERVSAAFAMSPASMKRKLKKHNTSFQEQLDRVRKNTAIYLYQVKQFNHHQIAEYLSFNDMNNFRRAFKRWTGFSPATLFAQS